MVVGVLALIMLAGIIEYGLGAKRLATGTFAWAIVIGTFYAVTLFFR